MNINVTATKVSIDNESLNKGEYNVRECNFDLVEEYEGLVCKALFTITKTKLTYEQSIVNGKCNIPYEATENRGKVIVGVVGYEVNGEELVKRYSPEPDEFFVLDGSYVEDIENQSTPTPTEIEQLEQRVSQIEIDAAQVEINTQDISDIKQEQTIQNNDILLRSLITETGSQIELSLNSSNFKMTATLKDKNGTVVNTSNEIDLPLESVVVNASYDSSTKEIILTLQNGNTVRFSVADLVSGLVSDTDYATASKGGVIKVAISKGTSISNGVLTAATVTYENYGNLNGNGFISKGTLENVITGKELVNETQLNTKADKSSLVTGSGTEVTLNNTAELEFIQPPFPRGNSEQANISYIDVGTWEQGGIDSSNGNNTSDTANVRTADYITVFPNILYNISRSIYNSYNTFRFYDKNKNYIGYQDSGFIITNQASNRMTKGVSSMEMTIINSNVAYMRITDNSNNLSTVYTMSTASPNPSYPQEITNVTGDVEVVVQNKNLFDEGRAGVYFDTNGNFINYSSSTTTSYIPAKEGDIFTISSAKTSAGIVIASFDKNKSLLQRSAIAGTSLSYTCPANTAYIIGSNYIGTTTDTQLEQGSTATTYTPHKEQTYTFPLGTQRMYLGDYLADDGIHHVRKQIELKDLRWVQRQINDNGTITYSTTSLTNYKFSNSIQALSDYLINTGISQSLNGMKTRGEGFAFYWTNSTTQDRYLYLNIIASASSVFENFLNNNNPMLEYELATEEIIPYTTEQQQAYDVISQAISYEEQTNISGSSDESNPLFEVQAVQYKEPDYWTIAYVNTQIGNAIRGAY